MRGRARAVLFWAFGAQAILACSLLTDYSLDSKTSVAPTPDAESTDSGGSIVDGPSTEDVVTTIDAEAGPICTATPCVVEIAAAVQNTCARLEGGVVKCWGWNNTGVVGAANQNVDYPTPQTVALDGPADAIAVGGWPSDYPTACARRGGIVDCWGADGSDRMLGRGPTSAGGNFNPLPAPVSGLAGATGDIAIGGKRVCARVGDGLACWGDDYTSPAGNGVIQNAAVALSSPKPVRQVAGGRSHHCVLLDSEEVACVGHPEWYNPLWNAPDSGRGPGGSTLAIVAGVTGIGQVATQTNHTCALKKTGAVLCWGRNRRGELGRGSTSTKEAVAPVTLPRPAKTIGAGANHTCAILDDDTVWCWGSNSLFGFDTAYRPRGQIGALPDGGVDNVSSTPRKVEGLPAGVKLSVVGGYAHTCVLMQDGSMYCFGANHHGQLGIGTIDGGPSDDLPHATPARVAF